MKTLSKTQIQALYTFTRKHYVEWYDVQTELVDHLANGIERQWELSDTITFEDALNKEFKKFGVFGFSDLVENKQNALHKHYRHLVFKTLKTQLKFSSIVVLILTAYILKTIILIVEPKEYFVFPVLVLILGFSIYHMYSVKKAIKTRFERTGKKWLFDAAIMQLGGFVHLSFIAIQIPNFDHFFMLKTNIGALLFALAILFYILIIYVSTQVVPKIIRENMVKHYPNLYL